MSDTVWAENFRKNLVTAVEYRDTSFAELSRKTGMARPGLSRVVNGKQEVTLPHAGRIAVALNIPLTLLIDSPYEFRDQVRRLG